LCNFTVNALTIWHRQKHLNINSRNKTLNYKAAFDTFMTENIHDWYVILVSLGDYKQVQRVV